MAHGENSKAVKRIENDDFSYIIKNYADDFSNALNRIYKNKKFKLTDIVNFNNSVIATVFQYTSEDKKIKFHEDFNALNIKKLTYKKIYSHLSSNRIIKIYPQKDTIVFIKPNQYRYWLSLCAYRDADKCISDFANAGL